MRRLITFMILSALAFPMGAGAVGQGLIIHSVRASSYGQFTRIVFEIETAGPYVLTRAADGRSIQFGSYDGPLVLRTPLPPFRDGLVAGMELRDESGKKIIVVHLDAAAGGVKDFTLRGPDRIVIDIARGAGQAASVLPAAGRPFVIALDPGHGGADIGLVTAQGMEKAATLEIAQAIRKILQADQRFKVILTRDNDQALSHDDRAAAANTAGAAIFVGLHAAPGPRARVYIEDLDDDADEVSAAPVSGDFLGFESGSEQQESIWGRQQAAHMQESAALGKALAHRLGGESAEPVQAPLAGIKAVDAAAAVVEIGMEQNRHKAAEDIAAGIAQYVQQNR